MNKLVKCVKITPDGNMSEVMDHREDEDWKGMGTKDGRSLPLAEKWGFRLSIIMQDIFNESDPPNKIASMIYHTLKHGGLYVEVLRGTVFVFNEDSDEEIDLTIKELSDVVFKAGAWRKLNDK